MIDFERLEKTDVAEHIEKKGKFSYLSWPFAVSAFRRACPDGVWEVVKTDGLPYLTTSAGCFVEVRVFTHKDCPGFAQIHPVLNYQNKPIKEPSCFDINTSIQRCLVKAIALATGIGLHIYAGEDLPPTPIESAPEKPTTLGSLKSKLMVELQSRGFDDDAMKAFVKYHLDIAKADILTIKITSDLIENIATSVTKFEATLKSTLMNELKARSFDDDAMKAFEKYYLDIAKADTLTVKIASNLIDNIETAVTNFEEYYA